MFKRFLPITLLSYFFVFILNWGCTKLDTTTLGSDLIPAVDNINTFADTLNITTTQGYFLDDSTKIFKNENNVLGFINDPIFGQTEANLFLQLKPTFYPYYFGNATDSLIGVDSVVLCLSISGSWGDTTQAQTLSVFEIKDQNFADSVFRQRDIRYQPAINPVAIGSRLIDIRRLKDTIRIANNKDSVKNQIRIKLDNSFANQLFNRDIDSIGNNNAFRSDSLFRQFYNGFAIKSDAQGKALMYISLTDPGTRLEIHFKKKATVTGIVDTVYNSFTVSTNDFASVIPSATSNYIKRNYSSNVLNPAFSDLYLQTGPGTYANLKIDSLATLTNRIIHRAQISIEQILEDVTTDNIFSVPPYMYLDIVDSDSSKWKPLYYDLSPGTTYDPDNKTGFPYFPGTGQIDYGYFGGFARKKTNAIDEKVYYYDLNVSRYVQQVVTKRTPNYTLRLFPGYRISYPQYGTPSNAAPSINLNNPLAFGRIKIKSGSHPDPKLKMRMIIIWSKIN